MLIYFFVAVDQYKKMVMPFNHFCLSTMSFEYLILGQEIQRFPERSGHVTADESFIFSTVLWLSVAK